MRLIGRRIPKNIGLIPEGFATRNNHTTIVVDSPMLAAPWLGNSFTIAQYAQAVDFCASRLTSLGSAVGPVWRSCGRTTSRCNCWLPQLPESAPSRPRSRPPTPSRSWSTCWHHCSPTRS